MYRVCRYLAKLFLFWLVIFALNRVMFLCVQAVKLHEIPVVNILESFYYALPLDVSAACYSCALPFLILWLASALHRERILRWLRPTVVFIIFVQCAIAVGDAALYTEWDAKLSWKALTHFMHPEEVFKTASWGLTILFFSLTPVLGLCYSWAYNRWIQGKSLDQFRSIHRYWIAIALYFPLTGFILFTGIRGGWKRFPISLGIAYYSQYRVLNDAAVNPPWYLIHDIQQEAMDVNVNPYHWMPPAEAGRIVDSLFNYRKDTSVSVLTTTRPNIMLFILESWPGDMVQIPGHPEITPVFDSLIRQGIYFNKCYATGYVSDEGIPGILSAFPTAGHVSVLTEPQKTIHLPAVNEVLDSVGYHTGFIYGGQLDFGNIQSYVYNKKFELVRSERDFPPSATRGALGVPDAVAAGYVADLVTETNKPFFYCWYTLSTHPPYDVPESQWISYGGEQRPLINTVHYADSSIGLFFNQIKDEPWYANTLFILVSDHSHRSQLNTPPQHRDRNRIPLLLFGDVIKKEWQGKTVSHITSQLDIVATLLAQMKLPHAEFPWSKDAFNPMTPQFAAINFLTGSGFITPEGFVSQDDHFPSYLLTDLKDSATISRLKRLNQAYEQQAYQYFLSW
jgi:phosphoglycerol transferase MdoB-like AlkP superfamily enzyme